MSKLLSTPLPLITHPFKTFRRLTLTNPAGSAVLVFAIALISVIGRLYTRHADVYSTNMSAFLFLVPSYILIMLTGLAIFCAIWHLTADMLGGAGRGLTLFYFVLLSTLPLWLTGPLSVLFYLGLSMPAIYEIIQWFLILWSIFLILASMKELYRFTIAKSLLTLLAAPVALTGIAWGLFKLLPKTLFLPW